MTFDQGGVQSQVEYTASGIVDFYRWNGRERCNDFSIGVELEGADSIPYTAAQYSRLARLTRALRRRYPITDLAGHSDIAPGRKTDPGASFDWQRYRALLEPQA